MTRLVEAALRNRLLVLLLFGVACVLGVIRLFQLPVDAFPDTTPVQVQVNTVATALSPEEIEQQITLPVELSIGGLPGLQSMRSVSKFGLSQVVVTFDDDVSIVNARQYVSERVASVTLPSGIDRPTLGPIATGLGEIFHYTVRSTDPKRPVEELRTLHDWVIKPELRKVAGVAEVNSWGGVERQFHVVVDPTALVEFDFTLGDVLDALRRNNANVGGGQIVSAGEARVVRGVARVSSIQNIENIAVATVDGTPVTIRDVASVQIGGEIRRGAVTASGKGEVVLGLAFMLMGENARVVTADLRERLDTLRPSLPPDVVVDVVYDRTTLVDEVLGTVEHNLVVAAVLVVMVLLLLLGNLRAGLLVAVSIPVAMLFAAQGMHEFAIAASLLSLGAIDFGILVDGSVVMTEANLRELQSKQRSVGRRLTSEERLQSIAASSARVVRPIIFGMGIIGLVFVPVLTLEGIEGKMFRPMAWTFIFALVGALATAIFLSPVLSYYFLPKRAPRSEGVVARFFVSLYGRVVRGVLWARWGVLAFATLLVVAAGMLVPTLGGEFIPKLGEGALVANTIRLAGVSIDESVRGNTRIESLLLGAFPDEIQQVWSRIGTAEVATDPMGLELTDIFLTLRPRESWTRAGTQAELVSKMQEQVSDIPGVNIVFTQPIEMRMNEMVSGIRSDIGVKIFGDDFGELVRLSDDVQRVLATVGGAVDISADQLTGQPTTSVVVSQARAARHGAEAREVLDFVEAIGGIRVGEVFEGQRVFPLVVRLPDRFRTDAGAIEQVRLPTRGGASVAISSLADVGLNEAASRSTGSGRDVSSEFNATWRESTPRRSLLQRKRKLPQR